MSHIYRKDPEYNRIMEEIKALSLKRRELEEQLGHRLEALKASLRAADELTAERRKGRGRGLTPQISLPRFPIGVYATDPEYKRISAEISALSPQREKLDKKLQARVDDLKASLPA